VTSVLTHTNDVAATGVVVSARPDSAAMCMTGVTAFRTETLVAPTKGSGLPVFASARTYGLVAADDDRTRTSKAVITQDPQPLSGEQLRKQHPPV
jgi:hypothetical protein